MSWCVSVSILYSQITGQNKTKLDRSDTLIVLLILYEFNFIQKSKMGAIPIIRFHVDWNLKIGTGYDYLD
jgi:hypothetical protein